MAIKSLNQRLSLFLLLPVAVLLFITGFVGFMYAIDVLLDQWREASVLKLQRAAHYIDMRLNRPIELINMFHNASLYQDNRAIQEWLFDQLKTMEGVSRVDLEWRGDRETIPMERRTIPGAAERMMHFQRGTIS